MSYIFTCIVQSLESVGHVVAGTVGAVALVVGTTVNAAGQIVATTVDTTGKLVIGTVNTTGKIIGGTVGAIGNVAGGSRTRGGKVSIPPEIDALVQKVLSGESVSPFSSWDDFIDWLNTSSDCADYSSTLINIHINVICAEKTVNEGIQFLAICLNIKKYPSREQNMVLRITVAEYEKKLGKMTSTERERELIAIMLYFAKLCELFGLS